MNNLHLRLIKYSYKNAVLWFGFFCRRHAAIRLALHGVALLVFTPGVSTATDLAEPNGPPRVAVTPEVLLRDANELLLEIGIPEFVWAGKDGPLVVRTVGRPIAETGEPNVNDVNVTQYASLRTVRIEDGFSSDLAPGAHPRSSPDGQWIAYQPGDRKTSARVMAIIRSDGKPGCQLDVGQLSDAAVGIEAVAWSHDGRRLFVASPISTASRDTNESHGGIRVYRTDADNIMSLKADAEVDVWSVNAQCGNSVLHARLPYAHVGSLAQLGASGTVALSLSKHLQNMTHFQTDVVTMNLATGSWRILVANVGGAWNTPVVPSPDGKLVAFTYDQDGLAYLNRQQIAVASAESGKIRLISRDLRRQPQWDPITSALLLSEAAPHASLSHELLMHHDATDTHIDGLTGSAQLSPSGREVAWLETDLLGNSELWVAKVNRAVRSLSVKDKKRLLRIESPLGSYARGEHRLLEWNSADGIRVVGMLALPSDYAPGHPRPLIVDLHGGPEGGLSTSAGNTSPGSLLGTTTLEYDMWASKGYVVLVPDYRESGMYGFDAIDATRKNGQILQKNFADIMSGVDLVVTDGIADPSHMALVGHSEGAVQVNWVVTHSQRFKAAVSYEGGGNADPYLTWGIQGAVNQVDQILWGSPLEHPERYWNQSALRAARGVSTPTLFISSHQEGSYPGNLNAWLYTAWRAQGIDAEHCIYLGEGHTVRQRSHQRDLLFRAISWIESHMR
jgi:dipeptidyl aminopeptidase/acylaminoacyl peptidase